MNQESHSAEQLETLIHSSVGWQGGACRAALGRQLCADVVRIVGPVHDLELSLITG